MRQILLEDYGKLKFTEDGETISQLYPGTVKVHVKACGICGSDIALYRGKRDLTKERYFGHEFSGVVVENGHGSLPIQKGTRIATELSKTCGTCWQCSHDLPNYCRSMNDALFPGGFTEETLVRHQEDYSFLSAIPDNLDFITAAALEPFNCAYHIARRAKIQKGDTVLVIGMGTIGILTAIILKDFGAGAVVGADINPYRLDYIQRSGLVDKTVNVRNDDWLNQTLSYCSDSHGTDIVVEATGVVQTLQNAFDAVRPGGRVVVGGVYGTPAKNLHLLPIFRKELDVVGAKGPYPYLDKDGQSLPLKSLVKLQDQVKKIITTYPFSSAERAFEDMMSGKSIKSVICF